MSREESLRDGQRLSEEQPKERREQSATGGVHSGEERSSSGTRRCTVGSEHACGGGTQRQHRREASEPYGHAARRTRVRHAAAPRGSQVLPEQPRCTGLSNPGRCLRENRKNGLTM
nr:MAG TPA: hypothetical protein [Caudoviricetes sp.]